MKYSKIVVSYIPGDNDIDEYEGTVTGEQLIFEDGITASDINDAIIDAGHRLMVNMGYIGISPNQNQFIDWAKYPLEKPNEYFNGQKVMVAVFDLKEHDFVTDVAIWRNADKEFCGVDDSLVVYWAPFPDPPVML